MLRLERRRGGEKGLDSVKNEEGRRTDTGLFIEPSPHVLERKKLNIHN